MSNDSAQNTNRFPWVYFAASMLPLALIGGTFVLPAMIDGPEGMSLAMACVFLIGPVSLLVVAWGVVRLWLGHGTKYPALRRLVWPAALVGFAGFALG